MIRVANWIVALALAAFVGFGLVACGGDDSGTNGDSGETAAAETTAGGTESDGAGGDDEPARSEEIDELLTMHPVFPAKRFLNFAARGNPGACSLLSDTGRKAMQEAHGVPCPQVIRSAAAERSEPGLEIAGEFVPIDDLSNLEYPTTIYVFNREHGRVRIGDEPRPMRLSKYGQIWLIDAIPLTDIGTVS